MILIMTIIEIIIITIIIIVIIIIILIDNNIIIIMMTFKNIAACASVFSGFPRFPGKFLPSPFIYLIIFQ
jgi:hypothetical protein